MTERRKRPPRGIGKYQFEEGPVEGRQCLGKSRYPDEMTAKIALGKLGRAGRLGPDERMSIYRCELCGSWHMGHSANGAPWHQIWR